MSEQVRHHNVPHRPKTANLASKELARIKQSDLGDLIRGLTVHDQMQVLHSIVDAKGRPKSKPVRDEGQKAMPNEVTFGKPK